MILGFYGNSNSGKTTLVVKVIKALKDMGYKVGSLKHIHEPNFTIDTENTDTWKHTQAGSELVVGHSGSEAAILVNKTLNPLEVTDILHKIMDLDIIIVEGFWNEDIPKVLLGDGEEKVNTVLKYKDNFDEIVKYAENGIEIERIQGKLPALDCAKCGYQTCREFAKAVYQNEKSFDDCHYFSEMQVSLEVDGKEIPMGKFAKGIMQGTIVGMISSLKEVREGKDIRIEIKS
jgi:molybdopterin-guanine dinucleotide biosynthesis protein B